MLPGESHKLLDNDGEGLFTEPPKKRGTKRPYGKLQVKPPDFEILEFGGGLHRKRYSLEFKLKAIEYAQSVVKDTASTTPRYQTPCHLADFVRTRWQPTSLYHTP